MRCLGHMYMTGVDGGAVAQDLYLAEKWLISAAATDDLEATYLLGVLLVRILLPRFFLLC